VVPEALRHEPEPAAPPRERAQAAERRVPAADRVRRREAAHEVVGPELERDVREVLLVEDVDGSRAWSAQLRAGSMPSVRAPWRALMRASSSPEPQPTSSTRGAGGD
jgi:hypothetical protein